MPKDYSNRKYSIIAYDPNWPAQYEIYAEELKNIFGSNALEVNHVGSTAVPEMAGKPTIDVVIFVSDIAIADSLTGKMQTAGFIALGEYVKPGARLFIQEIDNARICNVHVFEQDDLKGAEMLKIRDYFRAHPNKVKEYSDLKLRLYTEYPTDYGSYRKHKDEWMQRLVDTL
ncbi:MAG: hypothetical protein A3E36_04415 [Candidatus Andersenbacteria bacterium RIFCSPHIGHO2_12_FULL_45_11b]|uniref:GrpB family protein n=1 Tax=Candidatus Andersenbacteria bacterium RIFCSPHIGHO2_12_FULL_45_11b TaxID=1797282 RepID=A0A1G1X9M5_9BACT|nr:MAG: hypothetical protein A3E36_04415 [Candidatus Andersenbacteria bacterium RIFCSPHIGHO2_12_FULL_45_11b]